MTIYSSKTAGARPHPWDKPTIGGASAPSVSHPLLMMRAR